ncbi:MAG: hypothetical protein R3175_09420 [Marinobacter sp.]|uniref:hypothetical protein n=1 Tax=Marinobacter sp. TaxID=50741 RepID=UPI00299EDA67|nr:hypothetical protein [Marinobacter sp.]MDX1756265.1 hypothetical protein [Marinobacter sp.]
MPTVITFFLNRTILFATMLAFGLIFSSAHARELLPLPELERSDIDEHIKVNIPGHPIKLPLNRLDGAVFMGSNGESIIFSKSKHFTVGMLGPQDWQNQDITINEIPQAIFTQNYQSIPSHAVRQQVEAISINTFRKDHDFIGKMSLGGGTTAFVAYSPERSSIMITSEDKPHIYTDIVVYGFSWNEIQNLILNGVETE